MKRLTAMLMITAMIVASLSACGQVKEPETESKGSNGAAAAGVSSPDESVAEDVLTTDEETVVTEAPEESEPDETVMETTVPDTEPTLSRYEFNLTTVDKDYTFEEGFTFGELYLMGLANVNGEALGFAAVPSDGGAGHKYYKVYSTEDGGVNWTECEVYDELSGDSRHFAIDDGGLMVFNVVGASAKRYPVASILYFDGNAIMSRQLDDIFGDIELSDGRILKDTDDTDFEVEYFYDKLFTLTIKDKDGNVLYNEKYDLSEDIFNALQYPTEE